MSLLSHVSGVLSILSYVEHQPLAVLAPVLRSRALTSSQDPVSPPAPKSQSAALGILLRTATLAKTADVPAWKAAESGDRSWAQPKPLCGSAGALQGLCRCTAACCSGMRWAGADPKAQCHGLACQAAPTRSCHQHSPLLPLLLGAWLAGKPSAWLLTLLHMHFGF